MSPDGSSPLILIADDSEVSREYLAATLEAAGFRTLKAIDGGSALKVVMEHDVAVAIIDHFMEPKGGFDFARNIRDSGLNVPMIMVTNEETSDLLVETSRHGIGGFLLKPADPHRLVEAVKRALRLKAPSKPQEIHAFAENIVTGTHSKHTPDELLQKAIQLAQQNAMGCHGGPFGALIADKDGRILGQGVNGITSRSDPTAHAEVMAIRQATESLNQTHLRGCILYASSEPTTIGKALIAAVGLERVVFALSHADVRDYMPASTPNPPPVYEQKSMDEAVTMIKAWACLKDRLSD